jgi:L-alanine-DL-glutamate epimerase-like enolase superfamily enzyme
MPDTPAETRATVAAQREAGFGAVKLGWGPFGRDRELDVALAAAAREGGGDDFDLMLDIGLGWSNPREAITRVRRMEEHDPYWIEEPFMPDAYAHYAALAAAVDTPIAAGEEESVTADFERLIELGGVSVIQPDVTRVGGISELLRIVDLARARGRRLVPHSWSTGIIKAATLHVLAVMPEVEYFEYCVQTTELNQRLVSQSFPLVDGCVAIPDAPGLGVDLDEDVVRACLVA